MPDANSSIQPPPSGDPQHAEKYIGKLITLINDDKLSVAHTDLKKFDPSNLEDHYRVDLKDYQVEISHSKQATDGRDQYVMLFTNLQNVRENACEKIILAYMYLSQDQFGKFKMVAADHLERKRKEEEEKRLQQALTPIENVLDKVANGESLESDSKRDDVIENQDASIYQLNESDNTEDSQPKSTIDTTNL